MLMPVPLPDDWVAVEVYPIGIAAGLLGISPESARRRIERAESKGRLIGWREAESPLGVAALLAAHVDAELDEERRDPRLRIRVFVPPASVPGPSAEGPLDDPVAVLDAARAEARVERAVREEREREELAAWIANAQTTMQAQVELIERQAATIQVQTEELAKASADRASILLSRPPRLSPQDEPSV
jgi:hypothetical protein